MALSKQLQMGGYNVSELKQMSLCHQCVKEPYLSREIKTTGENHECAYCNEVAPGFTLDELAELINRVFDQHYVRTSDQPHDWQWSAIRDKESSYEWERDGEPVVYAIMNAAKIPELAAQDVQQILEEKHSDFEAMTMSEETEFASGSSYEEKGTDIQAWWELWNTFEKSLKVEARFFSDGAAKTLTSVFAGIDSMHSDDGQPMVVDAGPGTNYESFFRARCFQSDDELKKALLRPDLELGGPSSRKAKAGRMNAHGISVFYGSNRADVAIAEVRPPVGCKVAVARFEVIRPLRLLDLTALRKVTVAGSLFDPKFSAELERAMFLRTLSHEIVSPVMPDDEAFDYLPTQAVADFLAAGSVSKLDGILFPSVQAENQALNVALFHNAARVASLDIPDGTKIDVSDGHYNEEGHETYYTVWENLPPKKAPVDGAHKDMTFQDAVLSSGKLLNIMDGDSREAALRIDTAKIDVHHVQNVQFNTKAFDVTRHRMESRETPF